MNRDAASKWCERGIAGLVLCILVFSVLALGAVQPEEFLIVQGLTVGVLLLWLARLWLEPKPRLLWPPICWVVLAFTLYAVARYLTADIEFKAHGELAAAQIYETQLAEIKAGRGRRTR